MAEDYRCDCTVDRGRSKRPPDINGSIHSQQPLINKVINKCSTITTKLRVSKIVTPFPVFEERWDPNSVMTLADDQGGTFDVNLLQLLCFTRQRYTAKVAEVLKMEKGGSAKSIGKEC